MASWMERFWRENRLGEYIWNKITVPASRKQRNDGISRENASDHKPFDAISKTSQPQDVANNNISEGPTMYVEQAPVDRNGEGRYGRDRVRNSKYVTDWTRFKDVPQLYPTKGRKTIDTIETRHNTIHKTHEVDLPTSLGEIYFKLCGESQSVQEEKPDCKAGQIAACNLGR